MLNTEFKRFSETIKDSEIKVVETFTNYVTTLSPVILINVQICIEINNKLFYITAVFWDMTQYKFLKVFKVSK
jgi:hypothetical protein